MIRSSALSVTALTPPSVAPDLKSVLSPITSDMATTDVLIRQRLHSEVALINEIGAHIISAGGKRLRPSLVLLSARSLGATDDLPCLLAAVVEFIHTATLLHDDVVDNSDRRRGLRTANSVWGNAGAVLSGDFLYSRSFQMMVDAGKPAVMQLMSNTTNAIAEGEVLQLMNIGDPDLSEASYLRVIELKTARLFEAATRLGAIAADAPADVQTAMGQYGHHLGIAYQLVDDLIDYLSDPETSGKNLGADLAEGKPTLPLIRAAMTGSPQQSALLRDAICEGRVERLHEVLAAVEATDAIPYTRALAETHRQAAIAALNDIPDSRYKRAMQDVADFIVTRHY